MSLNLNATVMKTQEMKNQNNRFSVMDAKKITFVSAGNTPKKKSSENCLYLNYGLLGLATNLHAKGYEVKMYQGDYDSVDTTLSKIGDTVDTNYPIFLSVPSFLALSWAEEFVKKAKEKYNTKIVLGGRWTIDNNLEWIKNKMPDVDFFSLGCPDDVIEKLIDPEKDSLRFYELGNHYQKKIDHAGVRPKFSADDVLIL